MDNLVSIIVPIYNAEKFIEKCICSILNQTYTFLEIILIDDGSTDNSAKICDDFQKKDSRIKVIHKKNEGVAEARNDGMKVASGKYITFIDSDDWIDINYIEILLKNLLDNDADISICNYKEVVNDDNIPKCNETLIQNYTNIEAIRELNEKNLFTKALWSKLYKIELFEDVVFPNIKSSEDIFISYKVLIDSKKIVYTNKFMYYYRKNDTSITHDKNYFNIGRLTEGEKIVKYIEENLFEEYESTVYNYVVDIMGLYNSMLSKKIYDKDIETEILKKINQYYNISCKKMNIIKKIQKNILCRATGLYKKLYNIIKMIK